MKLFRRIAITLASAELWLVAFAVGGSVIFPRFLLTALAVAVVFWFVRLIAWGRLSIRTPLDWPLALLIMLMPVTLYVTPVPAETREQVIRLLTGIALYYAVINWTRSDQRVSLLLYAIIGMGAIIALGAPLLASGTPTKIGVFPDVFYAQRPAFISDSINYNVMAGTLVLFLPVSLSVLVFGGASQRRWQRLLAGTTTILLTLILIWTQSRGAWIAIAATGLLLVSLRWQWGWLAVIGAIVAAFVIVRVPGATAIVNPLAIEGPSSSLGDRVQIWTRAIAIIGDFPATGIGLGAFTTVTTLLYPFFVVPPPFPHAHNLFLQIAVDLGIPGLLIWLACVGAVGVCGWRLYQRGRSLNDTTYTIYGAAMLGSLTAFLAHGLTDAVTWGMVRPAVVVWGLWGFTVVAYLRSVQYGVREQSILSSAAAKASSKRPRLAGSYEDTT